MILAMLVLFPCIPKSHSQPSQDSAVIDSFIASQAHGERGEEYPDARKIVTGDLTRDGSSETVLLYTIESQNESVNYGPSM
jgi:hypothetical protein